MLLFPALSALLGQSISNAADNIIPEEETITTTLDRTECAINVKGDDEHVDK